MELRSVDGDLELRGEPEDELRPIGGLASVYYDGTERTEFPLWDGAVERIMPGAFDEAIKADDVRALFNHDSNMILGRSRAGTLKLKSTRRGLDYEISPGDTTVYRDVSAHLARGDVTGSSFAFRIPEGGDQWDEDRGVQVREITKAKLYDVGPVTYPAYEASSSGLRQAEDVTEARASYAAKVESSKETDAKQRQRDLDVQQQAECEVIYG